MKLLVVILLFPFGLASQVLVSFAPQYQDSVVVLGQQVIQASDSSIFTKCRFYVGKFMFQYKGNQVWSEPTKYRLIDLKEKESLSFALDCPKEVMFDKIRFDVGVDSLTNVSGAMGGDLDPTKGMYWAWNSGYVNFKLEGVSSKSQARKNEFAYHLGGYSHPNKSVQTILLKTELSKLNIRIDLTKFIEEANPGVTSHVMSPGLESQRLSELLPSIISIEE